MSQNYMKHRRKNIYLACEDMDFVWSDQQVALFDRMWEQGLSVWEIAEQFKRDPDDVAILAIDRARQEFIEPREGGAYGRRRRS